MRKPLALILSLILFLIPNACNQQPPKWPGELDEGNGVTIVNNPKVPLYGEDALEIEEELSIGEVEGQEVYMFGEVRDMAIIPNGNIYVLDSKKDNIKIYDSEGQYISTIGSPGQGPGELDRPTAICICGNTLYVTEGSRKFSCFSLSGEFSERISTKEIWALRTGINSDGNFIITSGVMDPDYFHYRLAIYDGDMNLIREIATSPAPDVRKEFNPFMAISYWTLGKENTIIYGYPQEYEIQIYNSEGQILKKIIKAYDPIEISEEEKKARVQEFPEDTKLKFPKYHSAFRRFFSDEEGKIFVQTWEKTDDEVNYYYDVFDQEGKYISKTVLPTRPHSCLKNKLYTIEEDEEGFHHVKRYRIIWK